MKQDPQFPFIYFSHYAKFSVRLLRKIDFAEFDTSLNTYEEKIIKKKNNNTFIFHRNN